MPYISSCSIACGGHAGSKRTIKKVVDLAIAHNVKIGAHPSFPDRANFGRIILELPLDELQSAIESQIQLVIDVCKSKSVQLHHIKPHGALYNLIAIDRDHSEMMVRAIKRTAPGSILYVPYQSVIGKIAKKAGLKCKIEAFADRNYNSDLTLVSRKLSNALLKDVDGIYNHLSNMIFNNKLRTIDGVEVKMRAETFCFHGDTPGAKSLLKSVVEKLQKRGVTIV